MHQHENEGGGGKGAASKADAALDVAAAESETGAIDPSSADPAAFTLSIAEPSELPSVVSAPFLAPPERPTYELTRPVFFVGFMVAGKTSVSRKLARTCGVASVDLDAYLERREGKTINQMFAEEGEEGFRSKETEVLREFSLRDPLLVSCGGGVVLRLENREILKGPGFVVYLQVTAEQAYARVKDVSTRPLFRDLETARKTINGRLPMYEEVADAMVDTVGKSIPQVAREVREILEREGVLCQRK